MSPEPEPVYQWLMNFEDRPQLGQGQSFFFCHDKLYIGYPESPGLSGFEITEENYESWGLRRVQTNESRIAWLEWRIAELEDHINQNWANI